MTTTSELRSQLENKGEEVSRLAHQIEDRLEHYKDWKGMVQERPLVSVAAAVGLGVVLSGAAGPLLRLAGNQVATIAKGSMVAAATGYVSGLANKIGQHSEA